MILLRNHIVLVLLCVLIGEGRTQTEEVPYDDCDVAAVQIDLAPNSPVYISTPNYLNGTHYGPDSNCAFNISAPQSYQIYVEFLRFSIEINLDMLSLTDDVTGLSLALSGPTPVSLLLPGNHVDWVFTSDSDVHLQGYFAKITAIDRVGDLFQPDVFTCNTSSAVQIMPRKYVCDTVENCVDRSDELENCTLLLPYRAPAGDSDIPRVEDDFEGPIAIPPFTYYEETYEYLFFGYNGVISFASGIDDFREDAFPINMSVVAPFWSDMDTEYVAGAVFNRQVSRDGGDEITEKQFQRVDDLLCNVFCNVNTTWMSVGTFASVGFWGSDVGYDVTNTFQVILTKDDQNRSASIFYYHDINWSGGADDGADEFTGLGGIGAHVGFNQGDGNRFFNLPGAQTDDVIDLDKLSNIGIPGVFVYRIDGNVTEIALDRQELKYLNDDPAPVAACYDPGVDVAIKCATYGCYEPPAVSWTFDNATIQFTTQTTPSLKRTVGQFNVFPFNPTDDGKVLTCAGEETGACTLYSSITIYDSTDVFLMTTMDNRPLPSYYVISPNTTLQFKCMFDDRKCGNLQFTIDWDLNGTALNHTESYHRDTYGTMRDFRGVISTIDDFTVTEEHFGKNLSCKFPDGSVTRTTTLVEAAQCLPGSYSADGYDNTVDPCIPCPVDTYQPEVGAVECLPCRAGRGTLVTGSVRPGQCLEICSPGYISPTGLAPCTPCEQDSNQLNMRESSCVLCPRGTGTAQEATGSPCLSICQPGYYGDSGLAPCIPCPFHFYQKSRRQTACLPCPHGNVALRGSAICLDHLIVVGCGQSIFVGPPPQDVITEPLNFENIDMLDGNIRDISYDPEERTVYTATGNNIAERRGVLRTSIDGTERQSIYRNGYYTSVRIDSRARKVYYAKHAKLYMDNMDATDKTDLIRTELGDFYRIFKSNNRILVSSLKSGNQIFSFDTEGARCLSETYTDPSFNASASLGIIGGDIDEEDGKLFWFETMPGRLLLKNRDVSDVDDGSSVSTVYEEAIDFEITDLHVFGDWVYFTHNHNNVSSDYTGLARIHKSGAGGIEHVQFNFSGDCNGLQILELPTRINNIPVRVGRSWLGGLIGHLEVPIINDINDWTIRISFPKQVFKLEIQGCTAEIEKKTNREFEINEQTGTPRTGTNFILRPTPEKRFLKAHTKLKLEFIATTYKRNLGIQRSIHATFSSAIINEDRLTRGPCGY
ncbi:uncharacterized protein [Amphiura filiformis]|uniref:uncharacterized protein n=1 Tax=Amphiura filiformis TaxID=82378 RepID=UPI003B21480D